MIKVKVVKSSEIESVLVSGHAEYSESGTDIVCAAVSTATILTANAIFKFGKESNCNIESDEGLISYKVIDKNCEVVQTLLENLLDALSELEEQFQNNIRIER